MYAFYLESGRANKHVIGNATCFVSFAELS